ncbi:MAG: hypothetical protein AAGA54_37415 [Myxococcota bacterium]
MSALAELIQDAGVPISRTPQRLRDLPVTLSKERRVELEMILHLRDGFRALGGALLVRPSISIGTTQGIAAWNRLSGWRRPYAKSSELLFFAEDIVGHQFGLYRDEVVRFDPERGTFEHYAFKIERWAQRVLEERTELGEALVEGWVEAGNPALETTQKLQPSRPAVLAGEDVVTHALRDDVDLMTRYARLFRETAAADGDPAAVDLWWWDEEDPLAAREVAEAPQAPQG